MLWGQTLQNRGEAIAWDISLPLRWHLVLSSWSVSELASCNCTPWGWGVGNHSRSWVPAATLGDLDGVLGSWHLGSEPVDVLHIKKKKRKKLYKSNKII